MDEKFVEAHWDNKVREVISRTWLTGIITIVFVCIVGLGAWGFLKYSQGKLEKAALKELQGANSDSGFLLTTIASCHVVGNKLSKENLRYLFNPDQTTLKINFSDGAISSALSGLDRAVLHFDWMLRTERWHAYSATLMNRSQAVRWRMIIIITGAIATILVTIKSLTSKAPVILGVTAVAFSATSTAIASWNAFALPATIAETSQQRVVSLRSIHERLIQTVEKAYVYPLCLGRPIEDVPLQSAAKNATSRPTFPQAKANHNDAIYSAAYAKTSQDISDLVNEYLVAAKTPIMITGEDGRTVASKPK